MLSIRGAGVLSKYHAKRWDRLVWNGRGFGVDNEPKDKTVVFWKYGQGALCYTVCIYQGSCQGSVGFVEYLGWYVGLVAPLDI